MEPLLALVILIVDIWAIIKTLQSPVTPGTKILWVVIIFLLPVVGVILWYFLGPRAGRV
jgi:hypothetical protein